MFIVVVATLAVLMHGYVWKRAVLDTTRPGRARLAGTVTLVTLLALMLFAVLASDLWGPEVTRWFAWPGYLWIALVLYSALLLLIFELPLLALRRWVRRPVPAARREPALVEPAGSELPADPGHPAVPEFSAGPQHPAGPQLPARPELPAGPHGAAAAGSPEPTVEVIDPGRRMLLARGTALVAGLGAAGIVGYGMSVALRPPVVNRVSVPLRRLPASFAGFRIAVVSDVHLGPLSGRGHAERIVRTINETRPDLVAIVGDLVDGSVAHLGPAAEPLRDLASAEGSFFVTGNHEYYAGFDGWRSELARLGVHTLENEHTSLRRGSGVVTLAGVNDVGGESVADGPDFEKALSGKDSDAPTVLLAHQPVQIDDSVAHGVDLQLSGHTHGGQMFPGQFLVGLQQPAVSGLSKVDDTWLYVTRGAGFWGPPVRVGAPPDITVVELS